MKHKYMKVLACLSLALIVFSAVTPGAFADETGTAKETKEFRDYKVMDHRVMNSPRENHGMNNEAMEAPVFETEEEEMQFLVERQTECINKRIERLQGMLENIDEIDDENITEDSINEQITELETLLTDIEDATTLDEFKEILEEARKNNPQPHGHGREFGPMYMDKQENVTAE
ncbi:hypothetical protein [Methanolobus psychrotolerans]|uniref:hypothetical protein n=1 Tax=Methanolobus psychrotolerans TaxID=1874706 RepID=UPI000B91C1E4|nr:hypothetical protein [Methanolobus psychrotolerans]